MHLLKGLDWCQLVPSKIDQEGDIQLMKNQVGLCWEGTHPILNTVGDALSNHAVVNLRSGSVEKGHMHSLQISRLNNLVEKLMDIEGLGVKDTCSCGNFKCGKCIIRIRSA